jgi:hypothetical protein
MKPALAASIAIPSYLLAAATWQTIQPDMAHWLLTDTAGKLELSQIESRLRVGGPVFNLGLALSAGVALVIVVIAGTQSQRTPRAVTAGGGPYPPAGGGGGGSGGRPPFDPWPFIKWAVVLIILFVGGSAALSLHREEVPFPPGALGRVDVPIRVLEGTVEDASVILEPYASSVWDARLTEQKLQVSFLAAGFDYKPDPAIQHSPVDQPLEFQWRCNFDKANVYPVSLEYSKIAKSEQQLRLAKWNYKIEVYKFWVFTYGQLEFGATALALLGAVATIMGFFGKDR